MDNLGYFKDGHFSDPCLIIISRISDWIKSMQKTP
jgi:hypothetical protein